VAAYAPPPAGVVGTYQIPVQTWTYVSITSQSTTAWSLFANGGLVSSITTSAVVTPAVRFEIGGNAFNTNNNLDGQFDNIQFWNFARTAAQLGADASTTFTGFETGLKLWLPMNEGTGRFTTPVGTGASFGIFNVTGTFRWQPVYGGGY